MDEKKYNVTYHRKDSEALTHIQIFARGRNDAQEKFYKNHTPKEDFVLVSIKEVVEAED